MKTKTLFTTLFLLISLSNFAQSDEDLIRHSIQNYFNGTSHNYMDQTRKAFHPEAELYLENKEGKLWKMTSEEYIALYKNGTPGEFGGRYNKILSIDQEGSLALVKAEILMPKYNKRYIDVFIMKEVSEGLWQILSKAANFSLIKED